MRSFLADVIGFRHDLPRQLLLHSKTPSLLIRDVVANARDRADGVESDVI